MIAGPSEVLVVADGDNDPDWIAADLLAQAEHDAAAQSILITDDAAFAESVEAAVERQLQTLPRAETRRGELARFRRGHPGRRSFDDALPLVDRIAAEHVELAIDDAEALARAHAQCRRGLPRPPHAGSHRRLCRRLQPRAADGALGALLVGPVGARFRQAHLDPEARRRSSCARSRPRRSRWPRPRGSTRMAAPSPSGSTCRRHGRAGAPQRSRLIDVELDESIGRSTPDVEHERAVAIFDLIEENSFRPVNDAGGGPYRLKLSLVEARLVFAIARENGEAVVTHILSLTPFRRIVKDYYLICESYYDAIRTSTPSQIEAIDMGRRGLHNEGSQTLMDRLAGKIEIDFDTARRLFTLVCVLHWRG